MIESSTAKSREYPRPIIWQVLDNITPSQKTALAYILSHGPTHGFELMKKAGLSRNTAYKPLQNLKKMGLIETHLVKGKPGQPMKQHSLTKRGVRFALTILNDWKVETVVSQWTEKIPSLFNIEIWKGIRENNLVKEAKTSLNQALIRARLHTDEDEAEVEMVIEFMKRMDDLTAHDIDKRLRWDKVIQRDIIVLASLVGYTHGRIDRMEMWVKQARVRGEVFKELINREPNWDRVRDLEQQERQLRQREVEFLSAIEKESKQDKPRLKGSSPSPSASVQGTPLLPRLPRERS